MFHKLQRIFNQKLSKLYLPLLLTFIDTIGTASIYASIYMVVLTTIDGTFSEQTLWIVMLMLVSGYVVRLLAVGFSQYLFQVRGAALVSEARLNLSHHMQRLPLGYFSKESIGALINTCTVSMAQVERIITHFVGDMMKVVVVTTYIITVSFFIQPTLALVQALIVILTIPLLMLVGKLGRTNGKRKQVVVNEVLSRVMEYLDGIRIFRSYNQTGTAFGRLNHAFKKYRDASIALEVKLVPINFLFFIMLDFIVPTIFIVGSYLLIASNIDAVYFSLFIMIGLSVSALFRPFSILYTEYKVLSVTVDHIYDIYEMQQAPYETTTTDFSQFAISFDHVTFSYEPTQPVLKDISFDIAPHTLTALIGPSGSGKSTILQVLTRFFDIQQGEIKIDGKNIQTYAPDALLQHMSIMFQHPFMLQASIIDNILMGKPDATREEVITACQQANCHDFIMKLTHGYDTLVGEGGSTLSGGEKQRLSLARAFLKDAPIILLDEATASLDPDNELNIKKAVDELVKGKTVIVIAHKLDTIQHADQILFLDDGHIIEQGTHATLIAKNGRYAAMYQEQVDAKKWTISS